MANCTQAALTVSAILRFSAAFTIRRTATSSRHCKFLPRCPPGMTASGFAEALRLRGALASASPLLDETNDPSGTFINTALRFMRGGTAGKCGQLTPPAPLASAPHAPAWNEPPPPRVLDRRLQATRPAEPRQFPPPPLRPKHASKDSSNPRTSPQKTLRLSVSAVNSSPPIQIHKTLRQIFRMLSVVCRHRPRPNHNPRARLQLKQEPLVRRDCGPRGDVCRSPTMEGLKSGPQTLQRFLSLASRGVKPGLMARSLRGALPFKGSTEPVPNVGAPPSPQNEE